MTTAAAKIAKEWEAKEKVVRAKEKEARLATTKTMTATVQAKARARTARSATRVKVAKGTRGKVRYTITHELTMLYTIWKTEGNLFRW